MISKQTQDTKPLFQLQTEDRSTTISLKKMINAAFPLWADTKVFDILLGTPLAWVYPVHYNTHLDTYGTCLCRTHIAENTTHCTAPTCQHALWTP